MMKIKMNNYKKKGMNFTDKALTNLKGDLPPMTKL